ncbi:MAG: hypothetical protein CSB13_11635 [Chloroflexi bacterium]|nr:MAG: hypothetical protein CSB13_11635 [Chloroflexota bacterium]
MTQKYNYPQRERQRLAWIILLGSFSACLLATLSVPLFMNAAIQNTKRPLTTILQANQGTVRVDNNASESTVIIAGEPGQSIQAESRILTDATSAATLLIYPNENVTLPLARLQVYSRSTVNLNEANTPRFELSDEEQQLIAHLDSGRIQLNIPESTTERPFRTLMTTPHGEATFTEPGQYAILVDNESTQVTVLNGSTTLLAQDETLPLENNQRGIILTHQPPEGPLDAERNLIQHGNFDDSWENNWAVYIWNVELADEPKGESTLTEVAGEKAIQFSRVGMGHADVKMRQVIDQDVTDYKALTLQLTFRITNQSLGVCGVQGSECPLFIRVNYTDDNGVRRIWQQGFYANGNVTPTTPDACISCAVTQDNHIKVPMNVVQFYEADLLKELARQGFPAPRFIEDISLVSSGHSFDVEIIAIGLVAVE